MSITIYRSPKEYSDSISSAYYRKNYFEAQNYHNYHAYESPNFFIAFDIIDNQAISIPRSPFGSIYCKTEERDIQSFLDYIKADLRENQVNSIQINHPVEQYNSFLAKDELIKYGASVLYEDLNQVIALNSDWESGIHSMQKRKLSALREEGFHFRKMESNEWETAYKFLVVCRQAQGVQLNISWEQLNNLVSTLPDYYQCFGVFRDNKISALCIAVNVSDEVAYYYLPATSPMFRTHSPMVLLIAGMVEYYKGENFNYLDLGVSSVAGKPQETLLLFKERMGASTVKKPTFKLDL